VFLPELNEIKKMRKKLKITQSTLSKSTEISQGLIAKIESGAVVPSYEKAKKIFEVLLQENKKNMATAFEVMCKKVFSVSAKTQVKDAFFLMKTKGVSQLPVIEKNRNVGTVDEKNLFSIMGSVKSKDAFLSAFVSDFMEPPLIETTEDTPIGAISSLLEFSDAVLVQNKKKEITGIVSRTDILNYFSSRKDV
jgi:predicted transcriptional regulator